jgi:hypothetical protein
MIVGNETLPTFWTRFGPGIEVLETGCKPAEPGIRIVVHKLGNIPTETPENKCFKKKPKKRMKIFPCRNLE